MSFRVVAASGGIRRGCVRASVAGACVHPETTPRPGRGAARPEVVSGVALDGRSWGTVVLAGLVSGGIESDSPQSLDVKAAPVPPNRCRLFCFPGSDSSDGGSSGFAVCPDPRRDAGRVDRPVHARACVLHVVAEWVLCTVQLWEAGVVGNPERVGVASSTGVRLSVSGDKPARWSGVPDAVHRSGDRLGWRLICSLPSASCPCTVLRFFPVRRRPLRRRRRCPPRRHRTSRRHPRRHRLRSRPRRGHMLRRPRSCPEQRLPLVAGRPWSSSSRSSPPWWPMPP